VRKIDSKAAWSAVKKHMEPYASLMKAGAREVYDDEVTTIE
jgi:hypothetical protein